VGYEKKGIPHRRYSGKGGQSIKLEEKTAKGKGEIDAGGKKKSLMVKELGRSSRGKEGQNGEGGPERLAKATGTSLVNC